MRNNLEHHCSTITRSCNTIRDLNIIHCMEIIKETKEVVEEEALEGFEVK
jgi:hypothetical protein